MRSEKHEKVCSVLIYTEHFIILASKVTGCILISAFATLVGITIEIKSSAIRLNICAITTGIKNYYHAVDCNQHCSINIAVL